MMDHLRRLHREKLMLELPKSQRGRRQMRKQASFEQTTTQTWLGLTIIKRLKVLLEKGRITRRLLAALVE